MDMSFEWDPRKAAVNLQRPEGNTEGAEGL